MIGKLTGRIDSLSGSQIVIDVQGVGYVVSCSSHTLRETGGAGQTVSLHIETHVREDAINLYGFAEAQERDWFRLLTGVQGVGAKSALAILSVLTPERLAQAIAAQDKAALAQADGVGPKLALRIVTELKDKAGALVLPRIGPTNLTTPSVNNLSADAVSALVNLGYRRLDAFAAVAQAAQRLGDKVSLDVLIKGSLAELSRKDSVA